MPRLLPPASYPPALALAVRRAAGEALLRGVPFFRRQSDRVVGLGEWEWM